MSIDIMKHQIADATEGIEAIHDKLKANTKGDEAKDDGTSEAGPNPPKNK